MTGDDMIKALLAVYTWRERKEGIRAMTGVLCALRNKAAITGGDWLKHTICDIYVDGDDLDIRNPLLMDLLRAVDRVFDGAQPDITGGATFYRHRDFVQEYHGAPTATIGNLMFFKETSNASV